MQKIFIFLQSWVSLKKPWKNPRQFFKNQFLVIPGGVRVRSMLAIGNFRQNFELVFSPFSHYSQKEKTHKEEEEEEEDT
jgi:hypothetical protein